MSIKSFSKTLTPAAPPVALASGAASGRARPDRIQGVQQAAAPSPASAAVSTVSASTLSRMMARAETLQHDRQGQRDASWHADGPDGLSDRRAPALAPRAPVQRLAGQPSSAAPRGQSAAGPAAAILHASARAASGGPLQAGVLAQPAVQGPVVNQDGSINHLNLAQFVDSLMDQFPPLPSGAPAELHLRREKLFDELRRIPRAPSAQAPADIDQLMHIHDRFGAAAGHARKLTQHLLGHRFPRHRDTDAALRYSCLAAGLVELKRLHLTAAAPAVMDNYTQRERANQEKKIPTLGYMSSSYLSRDAGMAASYNFGVASVELSGTKNKTIWFDDDRDVNFWNGYGGAVKGGGPSTWLFNASAKMGLEAGGTYFETARLAEMLQLTVNLDANKAFPARSADPSARARASRVKGGSNALLKNASALPYTETPGAPLYLNDRKLALGFNPTNLHRLGAALDRLAGTGNFGALVAGAYPAPAARLRGEAGEGVFREPLAQTVPVSDPAGYGRAPYRSYNYLSLSTGIGKSKELTPGVGVGGEWSAGLTGYTAQFHLQNPEASHSLLDPSYHLDMAATLNLIAQVDSLLTAPRPSKLHLYQRACATLGQSSVLPLDARDERYYGPAASIPAQFRDSMTSTDLTALSGKVGAIERECAQLRANYLDFNENAARLAARPDRFTPRHERANWQADRLAAFDAMNQAVWGARADNRATGYPGGAAAALKDPEKFIAQTHDAIGLALGVTGTHLAVVKRRIAQLAPAERTGPGIGQARAVVQQADLAYARTRVLLDKMYLPMKKIDVYQNAVTFEDRGLSQRHNLIIKSAANAMFRWNLGEVLAQRFGKSMGDYDVANEAGQIALSAQCRYQYADNQINPSRQGNFLEFKFTAQGGHPITGPLIVKGVLHALKKLHPEVDLDAQRDSILRQLQGLALDGVAGAGVVLRLRRFPDAGHKHFNFQFLRVFENRTGGLKVGVPVATPVGVFKLKWSKQATMQNVVFEMLGPDVGYLMLQHPKLKATLDTAASNADRLGGQDHVRGRVLRALFKNGVDSDAALANGFQGDKHASWVADSYFASGTMIGEVIDKYMAYAAAAQQARANGTSLADAPAASEFYRFFGRNTAAEPFHRVAEVALEAKHHAPGATVNWLDKDNEVVGEARDPFATPHSLLDTIAMPVLTSGRSWEAEKAHIKNLSFADRVDYFCSPHGLPVLDAFASIIEATKSVHDISRHRARASRYGFWTRLKDAGERRKAEAAMAPKAPKAGQSSDRQPDRMRAQLARFGLRRT